MLRNGRLDTGYTNAVNVFIGLGETREFAKVCEYQN